MEAKTKPCQNCKTDFTIEPEDFEFYEKIQVPEPTFCPECRLQRRIVWRNESKLYKRKCDFSGEEVFSAYASEAKVTVYDSDTWWSDKWDAIEYGKDYDFSKSFFEQLKELLRKVPLPSRQILNLVNSDYCMNVAYLKDCYLIFNSGYSENCSYGVDINNSRDSVDNCYLTKCELCYQSFMLINCYKSFFSSHCEDCQEIIFCKNCVDCSDCFGCVNLKHKKYHIFNKEYSKEKYFEQLKELNLGNSNSIEEIKSRIEDFYFKFPVKFIEGRKNNNTNGEYIYNSKNVKNGFLIKNAEDVKFCQFLKLNPGTKDCYDYSIFGVNAILIYESVATGQNVNKLKFCRECISDCRNLEYCIQCHNCHDCFASVGLRKKHHCILNRQYTKEEYEELVPKIKAHMNEMPYKDSQGNIYKYGEFFPPELSPFAYNETIAQEYFPLKKEEAINKGCRWYDKPKSNYTPTIKAKDLPDHIKDIDDSILKEVIECDSKECKGSEVYRIIPKELKFYKNQNLPLPRLCPDCRHHERIKQRNPMKLYERVCMKDGCETKFQTTYAPDRPEIVYCEKCYQEEVN